METFEWLLERAGLTDACRETNCRERFGRTREPVDRIMYRSGDEVFLELNYFEIEPEEEHYLEDKNGDPILDENGEPIRLSNHQPSVAGFSWSNERPQLLFSLDEAERRRFGFQ